MDSKLPVRHRTGRSPTTLPQWVKVLLRVQEHRFAIVYNKWTFREAPCSKFSRKICNCMLKRFNWRKKSSQQNMCSAKNLLIGCWKTKNWTAIFRRKSSLAMISTFNLMSAWTLKSVGFGARRILEWFMKSHCMENETLFGADFGLVEWLGRTFSKMMLEMQ